MFRDDKVCSEAFIIKFEQLKKKFDEKIEVNIDSEYHCQLKIYIERLYNETCLIGVFDDKSLNDIRDAEMSNLNRLQKLKNGVSYKKDKHKAKHKNEDWG
jgi:hypothetical protein